jgi:cytosine/adenosine deaminase-related metal-dependent hydrolase
MKLISADYIFPITSAPIKNGVISINTKGEILAVLNPELTEIKWELVERYEGIICPGFINTHCHLELSYLKGKVAEQTQLHGFVGELMSIRDSFTDKERLLAIKQADEEMYKNGIVAVGDISNGASTFQQKQNSKINYHTFVEVFGLNNDAQDIITRAENLKKEYFNAHNISITAHAPYSMSAKLKQLVNKQQSNLLTIHNQETASENELFKKGSGDLFDQLSRFSEAIKDWEPTNKNSLPSYLPDFSSNKKTLLVHNTFTEQSDIDFVNNYSENIYWCFCPNANLYIENKLPNFNLFLNEKCTIGTDSLASNWSLSVLDELKVIHQNNTNIGLEKLLKWATLNGAEFLGFDKKLGSLEIGKTPGLNLITEVSDLNLNSKSTIKKLV